MSTCFRGFLTLGLAMGVAIGTWADDLVIESLDTSGQLMFRTVPLATDYRVEWAPTPNGPWSNSWSALDFIEVHPRQQHVTRAVPMYYRVVATVTPTNPPPQGMVLVPAGSFQMADLGEGGGFNVYVSGFYMDRYEVTEALWDQVSNWAADHGYDISATGGQAPTHPVYADWYACVKWCNARSEMEGRTPAYYASPLKITVYRSGTIDLPIEAVRWEAGYRLPTEAEWEKAARGGLGGQRFPWGATIQHARANYTSSSSYSYDTSPTRGHHPDYGEDTSPVGSFAPNGYGLYDMAGNVFEWCWDMWLAQYYQYAPRRDPRGAVWDWRRLVRGGACYGTADSCRVAQRGYGLPSSGYGFRTVLPVGR